MIYRYILEFAKDEIQIEICAMKKYFRVLIHGVNQMECNEVYVLP